MKWEYIVTSVMTDYDDAEKKMWKIKYGPDKKFSDTFDKFLNLLSSERWEVTQIVPYYFETSKTAITANSYMVIGRRPIKKSKKKKSKK